MPDEEKKAVVGRTTPGAAGTTKVVLEIPGPIGVQLKQSYDRLLAEPLPDKFKDLLAQLAASSEKGD